MKKIVFDVGALISYLDGEPNAEKVADLLDDINVKGYQAFLCVINLGEIYYHFMRTGGEKTANTALNAISTLPLEIVNADIDLTLIAANCKANHKISYADAFAAALAEQKKATLVTGDKEFEKIAKQIKINWI